MVIDNAIQFFKAEGGNSLRNGDYDDAIDCFKKAIDLCGHSEKRMLQRSQLEYLQSFSIHRRDSSCNSVFISSCSESSKQNKFRDSSNKHSTQVKIFYRIAKTYFCIRNFPMSRHYIEKASVSLKAYSQEFSEKHRFEAKIQLMYDRLVRNDTKLPRSSCTIAASSTNSSLKTPKVVIVQTKKRKSRSVVYSGRLGAGQISSDLQNVRFDAVRKGEI